MPLRESLEWARHSREQWQFAHQQAIADGHQEDADFAVKQIAMFDRMIERFERLQEKLVPGYKSN